VATIFGFPPIDVASSGQRVCADDPTTARCPRTGCSKKDGVERIGGQRLGEMVKEAASAAASA
jgi:hypothetical protein